MVLKITPFLKATKCTCEGVTNISEKFTDCCLAWAGVDGIRRCAGIVLLGIQEDEGIQKPGGSTDSSEARWI